MKALNDPPPTSYQDALQQFLDRRRQRFAATHASQCEAIRTLVDKVAALGPKGPVAKLKQLTGRLGRVAATIGFSAIRDRASQLETLLGRVGTQYFDPAAARDAVDALEQALDEDVAVSGLPAVAKAVDGVPYTQIAGASLPPRAATERRGRHRLARPIRALIVDDHAMLRSGLKALLSDEFAGAVYGEASDAREALNELRKRPWDVAVIDIGLPGKSGLDLIKEMKVEWPSLPVLALSGRTEDELAVRVLKAGAGGYMTKDTAPDELSKAVRRLLAGRRYVSSALAEKLASTPKLDLTRAPHETLSDREYEVMSRIACGKSVTEIANELSLSAKTISTYRTRILQKLGVKNSAAIVHYAMRNGLVD